MNTSTIATKRFGHLIAEIEPNSDREGVNCYVRSGAGRAFASLAVLEDFGALSPDEAHEEAVDDQTISEIRMWAERYGY